MSGEARMELIQEMFELRDKLLISNLEWAELTKKVHPKGVSYQTIRRVEAEGRIPRSSTMRVLRGALELEASARGITAA